MTFVNVSVTELL